MAFREDGSAALPAQAGFLGRHAIAGLLPDVAISDLPVPATHVKESHLELRLGSEVFVTKEKTPVRLSAGEPYLVIPSGEFALLTTHEVVTIPKNMLGFISIKFRFKILGLVNISGFHVDPGYSGTIVFSVFNLGPADIVLRYLDPIFLIFFSPISQTVADARDTGTEVFKNLRGLPLESVVTLKGSGLSLTSIEGRLTRLETILTVAISLLVPVLALLLTLVLKALK